MSTSFTTLHIEDAITVRAPDGSEVRILPALEGGSMARFRLEAGGIARAIVHRTVEEIWYVMSGSGQMWRKDGHSEEVTDLTPGTAITIPCGCHFQFRASPDDAFEAVAITMPPWPGEEEAVFVDGHWQPTFDEDVI
ncbi:MAG: cupin domain-containing protein [Geminicoccaceae bacterium]